MQHKFYEPSYLSFRAARFQTCARCGHVKTEALVEGNGLSWWGVEMGYDPICPGWPDRRSSAAAGWALLVTTTVAVVLGVLLLWQRM